MFSMRSCTIQQAAHLQQLPNPFRHNIPILRNEKYFFLLISSEIIFTCCHAV